MSLLEISDLVMEYGGGRVRSRSLDGASLSLEAGEILALVGESGSGKSTLANAIGRLPVRGLKRISGRLEIDGTDVDALDAPALATLRRQTVGYIFQDPVATLDPTMKIGHQVTLALGTSIVHARAALEGLGLRDVERVLESYPHEISGGMAQRVAVGIALARKPRLIIADEPTAALDASIKRQVLDLLVGACRNAKVALLLVTHDLPMVRQYADRVAVMYGGRVVELAGAEEVLQRPVHPYTAALLASAVGNEGPGGRVEPISGSPPHLDGRSELCAFSPRCLFADERCRSVRPATHSPHSAICHYAERFAALEVVP